MENVWRAISAWSGLWKHTAILGLIKWRIIVKGHANSFTKYSNGTLKHATANKTTPNQQYCLTCNAFNSGAFNSGNCTWTACTFKHTYASCNSNLHGGYNCPHVFQSYSGQQYGQASQNNRFFRTEIFWEDRQCSEAIYLTTNNTGCNTSFQLDSLVKSPINIYALEQELAY